MRAKQREEAGFVLADNGVVVALVDGGLDVVLLRADAEVFCHLGRGVIAEAELWASVGKIRNPI